MWFFWRRKREDERKEKQDERACVLSVPGQYATIQEAVDAAARGSTVIVQPGRYRETVDFRGNDITVRSEDPNDPKIVARTIIDAGGSGSVVSFCSGETEEARLNGFTLTGGRGDFYGSPAGGGVTVTNGSGPTIENNVIVGNMSELDGGGIFVDDSWPVIVRNRIVDNEAAGCGGGIHVGWDSARAEPRRELRAAEDIAVHLDKAFPGSFHIAAVEDEPESSLTGLITQWEDISEEERKERPRPRIESNAVRGNSALSGGGLHISDESPLVNGNVFQRNRAGRGGGICFWDNCRAVVSGNHVIANEAREEGGGAIVEWGAAPAIIRNRFSENTSGRGRDLSVMENSAPVIRLNHFAAERGDAVFRWENSRANMEDNRFAGEDR
ncbi:MAG: right-handed parallel beta-helix repeat-containing protein [Bacillota bacterium]